MYVKELTPFDSRPAQIETNARVSSLPGTDQCWDHWAQNIWLSCSSEDVMLSNTANRFKGLAELSPVWQQGPRKYGAHAFLCTHGFVKNSGSGPPLSHAAAAAATLASLSYPWTNLNTLIFAKTCQNTPLFMHCALDWCRGNKSKCYRNMTAECFIGCECARMFPAYKTVWKVNFYSECQIWKKLYGTPHKTHLLAKQEQVIGITFISRMRVVTIRIISM